ncbi:MAG: hypothetical protein NC082_04415 [Clostridiales bacterium]|nr:hypothetical protein [Clostridiales bacterium]
MKFLKSTIILILIFGGAIFPSMAESRYLKLIDDADKAVAKNDYDRAITLLVEALSLEPDNSGNVMLLSNVGMLSFYTGRDSVAIHYLSMAHDIAPESQTILSNRAKVLTHMNRIPEALADYKAVAELDSTIYLPYLNMGVIYLVQGDTLQAGKMLERVAVLTDPATSVECTAAMAWLASLRGDNREALRHYSNLINAGEKSAEIYAARAQCNAALGNYSDASEDLASAMEIDSECADIYVSRAYLNKLTYLNDDALKDAQRAIDLGADPARVRKLLNL